MQPVSPHAPEHMAGPYCAALENAVSAEDSLFLTLPADFVTEARALGARAHVTASGFCDVTPPFTSPEQLRDIPPLPERPLIRELLAELERRSAARAILLNVSAPYSLLALLSSQKLPAWLLRQPEEVRAALGALTDGLAGYIAAALDRGVKVVSLADPQAQRGLLGEKRYRAFAAEFQLRLLERLAESPAHGVVHLCPYSFSPLEEYGLLELSELAPPDPSYERALLSTAENAETVIFIGHQCPHTKSAARLYQLHLDKQRR
ncbi:Uroporphyrinogen decarboxylase (URO-D) [Sporobacter termitidis DSM 10068]|uniref:Uroporphyrinogen decarboxylase (URO-D) n=1 Tax=Sporobacter termitidis DSM 10068 TaxID=1123282 RepID=A0A1M5XHA0_9FIRM|nr:uroporphyrinogen decarboxylase family protein [Sporobacter termitidis]SHH98613.1 Uroporphyrinogen decarboxylase (URO-D) [Sporobacter termitidis DSM 10068]